VLGKEIHDPGMGHKVKGRKKKESPRLGKATALIVVDLLKH